jgi:S-DNA-T family DNA segregation ATPase FtsK/SpoIIIE
VARLLRRLGDILDERAPRYAAARASSITEYRAITGQAGEARILLLVDGFGAFRAAYENQPGNSRYLSLFARILAEGRSVGVHAVVTADQSSALTSAMAANIQRRLVLRQADETAYLSLGVAKDVLDADSPPGRAVFVGENNEIQLAVPAGSASVAEQATAIDELAGRLVEIGVPAAEPVQRLTTHVMIGELADNVAGLPTLGLEDATMAPMGFDPRGAFMVAGLPGTGRTTALLGLAQSLRRWQPTIPMYYFGPKRSVVGRQPAWTGVATDPDDMRDLAAEITPALRRAADDVPGVVVMIEGLSELIGSPAEQALIDVLRLARRNGHFLIGEEETAGWSSSWSLVGEIRNSRRGIVMQPDSVDGDNLFKVTFSRMKRADFPAGRGVYANAGKYWTVQLPVPERPA